ncbi:MAG TPA: PQQ-binding-like beta-propeller repeat protein, partial [Gammaproteobacteria bacterium]|nr:PQQ-binding-like beta-propeller repeat protein [Gammaproteobacteria bacterium]
MDRPWPTYLHDEARTNTTDAVLTVPMKKAWDADVGDYRFFYPLPDQELSTPAFYGGVVYAAGTEGELKALDPATGRAHWSFDAGVPLEAPPAVTEERVCFGSSNGVVRCLERETGKELLSFQARSEVITAPVISDDRLYFASSDDKVHALDLETGGEVWTHSHGTYRTVTPRVASSPAFSDGSLFVLFSDGALTRVSAETGREEWSKTIAEGLMNAPPGRRTPVV